MNEGVLPKTGVISLMMIPVFFGLLAVTVLALKGFGQKEDLNILRVFVSVLIFFVFIPSFVILRNQNISKSIAKNINESNLVKSLVKIVKKMKPEENKITPVV